MQRGLQPLGGAVVQRPRVPGPDLRVARRLAAARQERLQLAPHARADLVGSLLRERDAEQPVDRQIGREDQLDDEVLEGEGLARPCGRVDDDVAVQGDVPEDRGAHDATRARHGFLSSLRKNDPKREAIIARACSSSGAG